MLRIPLIVNILQCNAKTKKKQKEPKHLDPVSNFKDTFRVECTCVCISRNYASLTLHKYRSLIPPHTVQNSSKWSAIKHSSQLTLPHPIFLVSLILFDSFYSIYSTYNTPYGFQFSEFFFFIFQPLERVPPRWGVKVLWNFNNDKL